MGVRRPLPVFAISTILLVAGFGLNSVFAGVEQTPGYMIGGGIGMASSESNGDFIVLHAFQLHCDELLGPNTLEVNWLGNKFHLEELERVTCTDDGSRNEPPPSRDNSGNKPGPTLDVYDGAGFGRYNGECGAFAEWVFDDNGEPGDADGIVWLVIKNKNGDKVLEFTGFDLIVGNHQFVPHPENEHHRTQTNSCD